MKPVEKFVLKEPSVPKYKLFSPSLYLKLFGIIIFEEPLLNFHYLGGLLVFAGVYLAGKKT